MPLQISRFFLLGCIWFCTSPIHAQTPLSGCFPNPGAGYECVAKLPTPYNFMTLTCGIDASYSSEAAAMNRFRDDFTDECTVSISPHSWLPPGQLSDPYAVACNGGGHTFMPGDEYGEEKTNLKLADVNGGSTSNNCANPVTIKWGAVYRDRSFYCPEGYSHHSQNLCSRLITQFDPPKNYGDDCKKEGKCKTPNPINVAAGNKYLKEVDYAVPGSPLKVVRYYNSLAFNRGTQGFFRSSTLEQRTGLSGYAQAVNEPNNSTTHWPAASPGVIGVGWRHAYQRNVVSRSAQDWTGMHIYSANGRVYNAVKNGGVWRLPPDLGQAITENPGGSAGYRLDLEDGSSESFDDKGRLTKIRYLSGIEESISYDSECDRVLHVTDSFGRSLDFYYTNSCLAGEHRISSITVPGGGQISYTYDGDGRLTTVTAPDGRSRTYHYENASFPIGVTGITDESGQRYSTYNYDAYGRANLSELAGGAERVSVVYSPANHSEVWSAALTTASNATVNYTFVVKQGIKKVESQDVYCQGCPNNNKSLDYDGNGNVTRKVDFLNQQTCYAFDTVRNLEIVRVEGFASAVTSCPANLATYTPMANTRQRKITTTWHPAFRLPASIIDAQKAVTFTYDASGNVLTRTVTDTTVSPNVQRTWAYTYNAFGKVLTEDGPRSDVSDITSYAYFNCTGSGQCGQLYTITNAPGHVTTFNSYNAHGQPTQITDANGLVTSLVYDLGRRVTDRCVGGTLPGCSSGEFTHIDYWPTGLIRKITNPDSSYIEYTYDAAHRLTQIKDGDGNRIVYTLDGMGNRTKTETFDPSNFLVRLQHKTFNALNQLWKDIGSENAPAVTTTFGYDANGNLTSAAAPEGRNSSNLYDELNRLKQVTDSLGGATLFGYDANDNFTSVTDPRGLVTSYSYNGFGEMKQLTSPDTGVTNNVYDAAGNLFTSTDARGKTGTRAYDALNRLTQLSFSDQIIGYTYDAGANNNGRLMQVTDGSGSTSWTYTALGRVASRTQAMGGVSKSVAYSYNAAGQLTTLTTPSGQLITYSYANNRISGVTVNSVPLLSDVLYDSFGPARQWTWGNGTLAAKSFDRDGNIEQVDSAGLKSYTHDNAFRITAMTDAENPSLDAFYKYDSLDRLTEKLSVAPSPLTIGLSATSAAPGDTVTATVNGIPNGTGYWLAFARTGVSSTTYNKWVQVVPSAGSFVWNVTMPAFAGTYEVRLFLNGLPALATSVPVTVAAPTPPAQPTLNVAANTTLPGSSVTVRLAGAPGGASDWLALARVGAANGSYLQYVYVGAGVTVRDWTVTMPTTEDHYEFRLFLNNGYTRLATSDAVRTTDDMPVSGSGSATGYAYDANGNRLSGEGSTYTISSTSNRLTSVSGTLSRTYAYDAAGNTTSYGGFAFGYNDAGRLASVSGGASAAYAHNSLGQRVKKTAAGATIYFVYDEAGHLLGEYDTSGNLIQETVWLGNTPVASLRPIGGSIAVNYVHTDHLSTPRRISRPSDNAIVWRWDSGPFGAESPNQDPDGDSSAFAYNLRFPGQYFDAETGLNYNYFRDYDPTAGRSVESDPIGVRGGVNTYVYVRSRPILKKDRLGLCEECEPSQGHEDTIFDVARKEIAKYIHASIIEGREYCGWICQDKTNGKFFAMPGRAAGYEGEEDGSCVPMFLISCPECSIRRALWHTHGAYTYKDGKRIGDEFSRGFSADTGAASAFGVDMFLGTPAGELKYYHNDTGVDYNLGPIK